MKRKICSLTIWWTLILAIIAIPVSTTFLTYPASAQRWQWPWDQDDQPRRLERRRPVPRQRSDNDWRTNERRGPSQRAPGQRAPGQRAPGQNRTQAYRPPTVGGQRPNICLSLEQQLALHANQTQNQAQTLIAIDAQVRQERRKLRRSQIRLDRANCYETFLFSRTLRRTRSCVKLDRSVERAQRQLQALETQRQQLSAGSQRSHQDDIIRELARNNCGATYVREARRRNPFRNFWQDKDTNEQVRGNTFAGLPFATYRTLCVRLCDGYYFPVSFSTLPTHFTRDADACQSRCAAPTELYFHQNPGSSVDQMISQKTQLPYSQLQAAFRYRKEFVPGCSCKQAEFVPQGEGGQSRLPENPTPPGTIAGPKTGPKKRDAMSPAR